MGENFQSLFFIGHLVEIVEETAKILGEEKAHIFVNLYNDWIEVYSALFDDVPLAVEGGEQLLMETPYPTFLFSASCPSLGSSKYALSIQSSL